MHVHDAFWGSWFMPYADVPKASPPRRNWPMEPGGDNKDNWVKRISTVVNYYAKFSKITESHCCMNFGSCTLKVHITRARVHTLVMQIASSSYRARAFLLTRVQFYIIPPTIILASSLCYYFTCNHDFLRNPECFRFPYSIFSLA